MDNKIILHIMDTTYVIAVAVKWPEPEFTCQLNGSATVQREPTRVREASEGLRGAEFCGLVAGYYAMFSQHQSATNSHQIWEDNVQPYQGANAKKKREK